MTDRRHTAAQHRLERLGLGAALSAALFGLWIAMAAFVELVMGEVPAAFGPGLVGIVLPAGVALEIHLVRS